MSEKEQVIIEDPLPTGGSPVGPASKARALSPSLEFPYPDCSSRPGTCTTGGWLSPKLPDLLVGLMTGTP